MTHLTIDYPQYSFPDAKYSAMALELGLDYEVRKTWDIYRPDPTKLFSYLQEWNNGQEWDGSRILYQVANDRQPDTTCVIYSLTRNTRSVYVVVDFSKRVFDVTISCFQQDEVFANEHLAELEKIYPPDTIQDEDVKVNFWYLTHSGSPMSVGRKIGVPRWEQMRENYSSKIEKALSYLIEDFKPTTGGQLIIFSGKPGTGKTYSLRAMLRAWKDWCTAEYILDPDVLFGSNGAGYLAQLVLRNTSDEYHDEELPELEDAESKKWRLLILEDGGELLTSDAKDRTGQGLSRLLNIVDGLIGQGLRILILITTNEDFERLHPAVARDGRCVANVKFKEFAYEDAGAWASNHGLKLPTVVKEYSLAELYSLKSESQKDWGDEHNPKRRVGFRI